MADPPPPPTPQSARGVLSRSVPEIQRVLESLRSRGDPIVVQLQGGELRFQSRLRRVDPEARRIFIERNPDPAVNAALLARPRCDFRAEVGGWHIEFVAANPREAVRDGVPVIELDYPELLVSVQRRGQPRAPSPAKLPLKCLADAKGVMPFEADIVDVGPGGVGFIVYGPEITLEPGTLLTGCQIAAPDGVIESVDLEVRYSQPIVLADGRRAMRSGCRFLNASPGVGELLRRYLGGEASGTHAG